MGLSVDILTGKAKTTAYQPTQDHWETAVHNLFLHIDKFGFGQRTPCPSRRVANIYLKPAGSSYSCLSLKLHLQTQHRCGPDALLGIIHSSRMSERDLLLDSCSCLTHWPRTYLEESKSRGAAAMFCSIFLTRVSSHQWSILWHAVPGSLKFKSVVSKHPIVTYAKTLRIRHNLDRELIYSGGTSKHYVMLPPNGQTIQRDVYMLSNPIYRRVSRILNITFKAHRTRSEFDCTLILCLRFQDQSEMTV